MTSPRRVTVCVCTYRRPQLAACLESVAAQVLPAGIAPDVVVIDNDPDGSARAVVDAAAADPGGDGRGDGGGGSALRFTYLARPERNLSSVRNAALAAATGELVAFLDDDEVADPGWLAALVACLDAHAADAVVGPVVNRYSPGCPAWVSGPDLLARDRFRTGRAVSAGHTANALLRAGTLRALGVGFDERFGQTGGEDTDFFGRLALAGATLVFCDEALVFEDVDPARENMDYLVTENRRVGQVFCRAVWPKLAPVAKARALAGVCAKSALFAAGAAGMLPFGRRRWAFWYLRALRNVEKLRYLATQRSTIRSYCR